MQRLRRITIKHHLQVSSFNFLFNWKNCPGNWHIWLGGSGILGASPDGIVDEDSVLEAKCPDTERNMTIEEAVNSSPNFCLKKTESGQYALKEEHVYCHQVQGEIYFSRRKFCYFVVWTSKDVVVLKIAKAEAWSDNILKLTQFYFEHLFPKVVEGQL